MSATPRLAEVPPAPSDPHRVPGYARRYEDDRYGGAFGAYLKEHEIARYRELLGPVPGSVLDVGTGTGKLAFALAAQGRAVTACDRSIHMLDAARSESEAGGGRPHTGSSPGNAVRLVVCEAERLCFGDGAFDVVVSSRVLMHVGDWEAAVAEACRVASGAVVADFPARWSAAGVDALRKRLLPVPEGSPRQPYRTFRLRDVRRAFRRAGYEVVVVRRSFCLPVALHRKLNRPDLTRLLEGALRRVGVSRIVASPFAVRAVPRPPGAHGP